MTHHPLPSPPAITFLIVRYLKGVLWLYPRRESRSRTIKITKINKAYQKIGNLSEKKKTRLRLPKIKELLETKGDLIAFCEMKSSLVSYPRVSFE